MSEKIKTHLLERMRLTPNIQSLEKIMVYILSQEADDYARKNTHDKAKVNRVGEGDGDPPKKEQKCRIVTKSTPEGVVHISAGMAARKAIRVMAAG